MRIGFRMAAITLAALIATGAAVSGGTAAMAASTGHIWTNAKDEGQLNLPGSASTMITFSGAGTVVGAAMDCNGAGWCEHSLPGSNQCMTWESGNNTIKSVTCQGLDRQLWLLTSQGNNSFVWENYYADSFFSGNGSCLAPYMTANGLGNNVTMHCPASDGSPEVDQEWIEG